MGAFPSAAAQAEPFDPFKYRAKALQTQALQDEQTQRQQQTASGALDLQMKQRQQQDQQTIMQVAAAHNGNLAAAMPELAGKVSAATFIPLQKSIIDTQKSYAELDEKNLANEKSRSDQLLGLVTQAKQLPPDQYAQVWPSLAQKAIEIEPRLKGHVDPAQPVPQQGLDQLALGFATHSQLAGVETEKRAQAKAAQEAAKAPSELAESQAKAAQAGKVNAGTDATGLTAENRVQQTQARATLSENSRHNKEMESVASDKLSEKSRDFIDKNYVKPANDVEKSYQMFLDAYKNRNDAKTGAESMLALSTHLATTFGNVKGARVTKDMIEHHMGARGIGDSAVVAVQKLTNGDVLSPDQWDAFKSLITQSRNLTWDTAKKEATRRGVDVTGSLPADVGGKSNDPFAQFGGKPRQ